MKTKNVFFLMCMLAVSLTMNGIDFIGHETKKYLYVTVLAWSEDY